AVDVGLQPELYEERATIRPGSRLASIDVDEPHLIYCARAHIADLARDLPRQLTLDEKVERVNSVAHRLLRKSRRAGVRREREDALRNIGGSARINQPLPESGHGDERVVDAVELDRRHRPDVGDRVGIPDILEGPRVSGL